MEYLAVIILAVITAMLAVNIIVRKLQIRTIRRELSRTITPSYDRQLSVVLFNRELSSLAAAINLVLDNQRRLKLDAVRAENNLRQSLSDIAHDFRTPMTVIKGNLQLLAQEEHLSQQGSEYLDVCRQKADKLQKMADAFFELAVLESDDVSAEIRQVNLSRTLMEFLAESEAAIRLHGLEPQIIFPEKTVLIRADEQMLVRMLGNVLNNIYKYAQESFRLELRSGAETAELSFSNHVRSGEMPDTGMIFERSYRADASRSGENAGLGLFIVRLLAEKQGAKVSASADGDVLTLTMSFPTAH